ncbi:EamA family transporter [Aggregatibacter actinomycetemcomitans]|uniref:EamA family transporter n=1 Tax=Aggregatibacter actinomycetemcomitans TaxID=714 RepID=UPI00197B6E7F|nr:EamA family transporter [Aggregatibacter actinomycetemcomitans]MBN6064258.1 EamA family transporter [Aggregatibacter actinomycetemcomitans]MBN6081704.1 EamA family transporter [Aggregatibacter actinomycetemcomitans]MBN6084101.1 EamA family transporter [Aggregatibacter actinomycetemcomitans]
MNWVWFAIGSAFFAGLTAILGKLGVEGLNSNLATFIRTVVILFVIVAIISMRNEWQLPQHITTKPVIFLVLSGVATGLSWLCYYRALQLAPASWVAPIDKLSVVIAIVLGVTILGEPVSMKLLIGAGLILSGVLVLAF